MAHGRPAKRRRLSPLFENEDQPSETIAASDLFNHAAEWDLEETYLARQKSKKLKMKESNRLPTKAVNGTLEAAKPIVQQDDGDSSENSFLNTDSDDDQAAQDTPATDIEDGTPEVPLKQQLLQIQEEVARLAGLLQEDPEEHSGSFRKIAQLANEKSHPGVRKLILLSQAAVYKDVAPGYRIRAYRDDDLSNKVSKDVRQQRQYEHSMVTNYQAYVRELVTICRSKDGLDEISGLRMVAMGCACTLLLAIPHFNFRTELLGILVREAGAREATPYFTKAVQTLQEFFEQDEEGGPSLEAVNLLSKMIKARDYDCREEALNTFLHLRLLGHLSIRSSTSRTDRHVEDVTKLHGKQAKKDRFQHRTKKERKIARERKVIEKEMREADAAVDYESREKIQSETLKVVFITYFRVLKAQTPHLMGAVLEGLAKYAHLINQDFFGDILEALKDVVREAEEFVSMESEQSLDDDLRRDRTRESLLAVQTAFTLLSQQETARSASALHLDLSFFSQHVYRALYSAATNADIELGSKSVHLPDPHSENRTRTNKVNISTPILLLTRTLSSILLTPAQPPTNVTVTAMYKRLLTTSLHLPEKSLSAVLVLLQKIVDKHSGKLEPLWYSDERKGDGVFRPESDTVEGTNVLAVGSGVWEGELLKHHFDPVVKEKVKAMDKTISSLRKQN